MSDLNAPRPSFAPRNWGGWLAVGILWTLGHLPWRLGQALTAPLGPLLYHLMAARRRIAARNLAACFPELGEAERQRILKGCFRSLARMLPEMAWCWAGKAQDLQARCDMIGLEMAEDVVASGQGVLVVTAHFSCLEIGARALGERFSGQGIYRPLGNAVLEWYQNRGRAHYATGMITKRDIRAAVRYLRRGGFVWYAPDQDFGPRETTFVPFFGIPTATLLASHRLPQIAGCRVVTMFPHYIPETRRYRIEVKPLPGDFPTSDPVADLAMLNAQLEAQVRAAPEQYWWIHRRFKTRPEGAPKFYA